MSDTKPRRYWIRKGTGDWNYEVEDENDNLIVQLGDSYYDAVSFVPAIDGTEVVDASAYDALEAKLDALKKRIGQIEMWVNTYEKMGVRYHSYHETAKCAARAQELSQSVFLRTTTFREVIKDEL